MNIPLEIDFTNFKPDIFLAELKKRHSEFKKIDDVEASLCDYYSWLNFSRYYIYLESYLSSDKYSYYFIMSNHEFSINIKQLRSMKTMYHDDNDENEKQTFLIEGNFSASNMFSNMHKINRLLKLISYD